MSSVAVEWGGGFLEGEWVLKTAAMLITVVMMMVALRAASIYWLCTVHCFKCFAYINPFNPQGDVLEQMWQLKFEGYQAGEQEKPVLQFKSEGHLLENSFLFCSSHQLIE